MQREQAQTWADERNMQTLTTAMGPLMDPRASTCLQSQKSSNVRIIIYFGWEHHFSTLVNRARTKELKGLRRRFIMLAIAETTWDAVPILFTFLSFLC